MSGYLSNIIQRNALPESGQAGLTHLTPAPGYTGLFGPGNLSQREAPEPLTEEPFYPVSSPVSSAPFSGKKEVEAPQPHRMEHGPKTEYIERHLIRTRYEAVVERPVHHPVERVLPEKPVHHSSEQAPPEYQQPAERQTRATHPKTAMPAEAIWKPAKENRRTAAQEKKKGKPAQLLQPVADTREITILKPTTPIDTTSRREKKTEAPKLVIGRLTVEVVRPAPNVQTVQQPVRRQQAPPEPKPFKPYNKLTFGLGQL